MIMGYEAEMQKQVTERWKVDMNSDSWLSKNIRPLVLVFLVVATVLLIFIDGCILLCDLPGGPKRSKPCMIQFNAQTSKS